MSAYETRYAKEAQLAAVERCDSYIRMARPLNNELLISGWSLEDYS